MDTASLRCLTKPLDALCKDNRLDTASELIVEMEAHCLKIDLIDEAIEILKEIGRRRLVPDIINYLQYSYWWTL
ncbi:hypothetical protein RDABS01_036533 [Bienertia sinuspersici]